MGILTRYIIKEILKLLFPLWFSLGFFLFILEWLAQVFNVHAPTSVVLKLYLYKMPSHLSLVFPVALLLSCLITLGTMNRNREIVALQSIGFKWQKIIIAVLAATFLGAATDYWISDQWAPWGMKKHYEVLDSEVNHVPSRFSQIRQEKIWYRNQEVLYNVRYFAHEKDELYDVTIYTFDENFQIAQTIFANKAKWNGSAWNLTDGVISFTDRHFEVPKSESFTERTTQLIEDPKQLRRVEIGADTMTQNELRKTIIRNRALGINTAKWEVIYQSRLSFVAMGFVFMLLAFPVALRYRRGGGMAKDAVFVVGASLVYWLFYSFSASLGNAGKLHPTLAAWGPTAITFVGVVIFLKNLNLKTLSS